MINKKIKIFHHDLNISNHQKEFTFKSYYDVSKQLMEQLSRNLISKRKFYKQFNWSLNNFDEFKINFKWSLIKSGNFMSNFKWKGNDLKDVKEKYKWNILYSNKFMEKFK